MTDALNEQGAVATTAVALRQRRVRRFSVLVVLALIIACNAVIALGVWSSGVNLDGLFRTPDLFNPNQGECLRYSWHKVSGVQQPVRLCYEWIDRSDPSGNTHTFQPDTGIVLGADGKLHYEHGERVDSRLFVLLVFVGAVLALGVAACRFLIARYRRRLEARDSATPS
jgi:hypothetical protein